MKKNINFIKILVLIAVALPLAGISSLEALLAPKADLWERWTAHDPNSTATIDHSGWDRLLARYLKADADGLNRFDYKGVSQEDRAALKGYISRLARVPISTYARPEQRAFWINLYNALTVDVVLDHYPVASIRDIDISPGLFSDGPWGKTLVAVEDTPLALNDIEHRILRPIWRDPRIHYAVNCASAGCPNLARKAYTAAAMEPMLEAAAHDYINSPRGAHVGKDGLVVSSIYVWFQDDFGGDDKAVVAHLRRYADAPLKQALEGRTSIDGHAYDWSLNETRDRS
jgi:Protein of unknown function, DUF547